MISANVTGVAKVSAVMFGEDNGLFKRYVDTPKGGYRIIKKSLRDSKILRVSYVDKNGVEHHSITEWSFLPLRRRMWYRIASWFKWFVERL